MATVLHPDDVRRLLDDGPAAIRSWIETMETTRTVDADDLLSWLLLADVAAGHARRELDLEWAEVAVRVYELIATTARASSLHLSGAESALVSAMTLRAYMLRHLGMQPGSAVLDPSLVFDWFLSSLPYSFDDAAAKTRHALELPAHEILELRRVRNRLAVVNALADLGIPIPPKISPWRALQPRLP